MQITKLENGKYIIDTVGQYEADFLDRVYEAYKAWQEKEYPVFKSVCCKQGLKHELGQFQQERD